MRANHFGFLRVLACFAHRGALGNSFSPDCCNPPMVKLGLLALAIFASTTNFDASMAAPDACTQDSTDSSKWVCSGQQDGGIYVGTANDTPGTARTIIVENLTTDLEPPSISDQNAFTLFQRSDDTSKSSYLARLDLGSFSMVGGTLFFS